MDRSKSINAYLLTLSLLFVTCDSATYEYMSQGQSIKDGDILLSPNQHFAMGFFNTTPESNRRYVGIWYNKVPLDSIVWTANRERPVEDLSGVFVIRSDGNLAVLDGKNTEIWFTSITNLSSPTSISAFLLDTGNLVLQQGNSTHPGTKLWQSFDHPTNTFLPNMTLGIDPISNQNREFTSWESPEDPAPGIYTLRANPQLLTEVCIYKGSSLYWRSGSWNGRTFEELKEMSSNPNFNFGVTGDGQLVFFTYSSLPNNYARIVVESSGHVTGYVWENSTRTWTSVSKRPKDPCDIHSACGVYGVCNISSTPFCRCPERFKPVSIKKWNNGEWSDGCQRNVSLNCGSIDEFIRLKNIKLSGTQSFTGAKSAISCRAECLRSCRCTAYVFSNFSNIESSKCVNLDVDPVDLRLSDGGQGHDLYLRISSSDHNENTQTTSSSNGKKKKILIITIVVAVGLLLLGAFICLRQRLNKRNGTRQNFEPFPVMGSSTSASRAEGFPIKSEHKHREALEIPLFGLEIIKVATSNFSDANKLGQGGFGAVYKGSLPEGQLVAVKRLSCNSQQGLEEFRNEVMLIAKLQHRNLVRLLGYSFDKNEQLLLYEYMPNKSLDLFLFDETRCKLLNWSKRFNIILGIARGLLYLHQDSRLRVIHRDLKASNILLDEEMNPKISDFGLARIVGGNQTEANTKRVVGTYGYMSPEYALDGFFSVKSDVYSFGVLLLEIISGKKNSGLFHHDCEGLLEYVWRLWNEEKGLDLIDPSLIEDHETYEVLKCIHLGLLCVQQEPIYRPTIASVLLILRSEVSTLPTPSKPTFFARRNASQMESSSSKENTNSKNELTHSLYVGR